MFNSTSPVAQLPRPSRKLKAIDIIRQSSIGLTFEISLPSYNFNATNYINHSLIFPFPDLRNLSVNSTFYYPLQIFQSPIQLNLTIYTAGKSGLLEAFINNDQFTQIKTPETANTTIFQAAPTIQFNINQTILPSIVALRLKKLVSAAPLGLKCGTHIGCGWVGVGVGVWVCVRMWVRVSVRVRVYSSPSPLPTPTPSPTLTLLSIHFHDAFTPCYSIRRALVSALNFNK